MAEIKEVRSVGEKKENEGLIPLKRKKSWKVGQVGGSDSRNKDKDKER